MIKECSYGSAVCFRTLDVGRGVNEFAVIRENGLVQLPSNVVLTIGEVSLRHSVSVLK